MYAGSVQRHCLYLQLLCPTHWIPRARVDSYVCSPMSFDLLLLSADHRTSLLAHVCSLAHRAYLLAHGCRCPPPLCRSQDFLACPCLLTCPQGLLACPWVSMSSSSSADHRTSLLAHVCSLAHRAYPLAHELRSPPPPLPIQGLTCLPTVCSMSACRLLISADG